MAMTDNDKLALMSYQMWGVPSVPFPVGGSLSQGDLQQLLHGYPGINWAEVVVTVIPAQYEIRMKVGKEVEIVNIRIGKEVNIRTAISSEISITGRILEGI